MAATKPVFKITPTVQNYDWGHVGRASKVAQLAEAGTARGFVLDEAAPYAEVRSLTLHTLPRTEDCKSYGWARIPTRPRTSP
jgi:hypothetical protein